MASLQCHKPIEQTKNHAESTVVSQKTTTQTCHKANSEHSFANKVKEMANSARKMLTEHKHQERHGQNGGHHTHYGHHARHGVVKTHTSINHHEDHSRGRVQQSARQGSHLSTPNTAATDKKKKEGHGGNCIANFGEHIKNMKKKKNRKAGMCNNGASSDSSSSDDGSNNKTSGKKN